MAHLRPKIVKLCHVIGGISGVVNKIDENAPEYYALADIVSDEEADIAIAAGLRKARTAGYLAKKVGKTVEEIMPSLDNLVYYGVFRRTYSEADGQDVYFMQIFAPGILEMMVNHVPLMTAHPEIGRQGPKPSSSTQPRACLYLPCRAAITYTINQNTYSQGNHG